MPANTRPSAENPERRLATNAWIRALENTKVLNDRGTRPLCAMLDDLAASHGDAVALLGENEALSFRELAARANRYAHWGIARGFVRGEVICLLMPNCPEYAAVWLGLNRAGCAVALLNTNLSGEALLHSIRAAGSRRVIAGESLLPAIVDVADQLPPDVEIWLSGTVTHGDWLAIEPELAAHAGTPISDSEREPPSLSDRSLLIYTSGTTGLPKAANITHARVLEWSFWFAGMMDTQREDRIYNCLPMYHSTGGVVAIGAMLVKGGSVLIRARFLGQPLLGRRRRRRLHDLPVYRRALPLSRDRPAAAEGAHAPDCAWPAATDCRAMSGRHSRNGSAFRGSSNFTPRPRVTYRSTIAKGRRAPSAACRRSSPTVSDRVDPLRCRDTGAPMRDAERLLHRLRPRRARRGDRTGRRPWQARRCVNSTATRTRQHRPPDCCTTCSLRATVVPHRRPDAQRCRRLLSISSIASATRSAGKVRTSPRPRSRRRSVACPGVTEAVVFGVTVPGHEGRAGMAAITTDARFDLADTARPISRRRFPIYARPLFVRCCRTLDVTGHSSW